MLKIGAKSCSKNARDNFCNTLSTVHIRIYKVETQKCTFVLISCSNQLCLWNRDGVIWKQYKKYPTFPFFYLINCHKLPPKLNWKSLNRKYGKCHFNGLLKPLTMACFGSNCFSQISWHTSNLIKWTKKARF